MKHQLQKERAGLGFKIKLNNLSFKTRIDSEIVMP